MNEQKHKHKKEEAEEIEYTEDNAECVEEFLDQQENDVITFVNNLIEKDYDMNGELENETADKREKFSVGHAIVLLIVSLAVLSTIVGCVLYGLFDCKDIILSVESTSIEEKSETKTTAMTNKIFERQTTQIHDIPCVGMTIQELKNTRLGKPDYEPELPDKECTTMSWYYVWRKPDKTYYIYVKQHPSRNFITYRVTDVEIIPTNQPQNQAAKNDSMAKDYASPEDFYDDYYDDFYDYEEAEDYWYDNN